MSKVCNVTNSQLYLSILSTHFDIPVQLFQFSLNPKYEKLYLNSLNGKSLIDKLSSNMRNEDCIFIMLTLDGKKIDSFINILASLNKLNKSLLIELEGLNLPHFAVIEPISNCSAILFFFNDDIITENLSSFNTLSLNQLASNVLQSNITLYGLDKDDNESENINYICDLCKNKITIKRDAVSQTNNKYFDCFNAKIIKNKRNTTKLLDANIMRKKIKNGENLKSITPESLSEHNFSKKRNDVYASSILEDVSEETDRVSHKREMKVARRMLSPSKHFPLKRSSPALKSLIRGEILSPSETLRSVKRKEKAILNRICSMDRLGNGCNQIFVENTLIKSKDLHSSILDTPTRSNRLRTTPSKYNDFHLMSPTLKKTADVYDLNKRLYKEERPINSKFKNKEKICKLTPKKLLYPISRFKKSKYTPDKEKILQKSFKISPRYSINKAFKRNSTNEISKKRPMLIRHGSSVVSNRAEIILQKSKEVAKQRSLKEEDSLNKSNNSLTESLKRNSLTSRLSDANESKSATAFHEHKNEEDLLEFLKMAYMKIVEGEGSPFTGSKSIVGVCLKFFNEKNYENAHAETSRFVTEHLLKSNSQIREQYINKSDSTSSEAKLREYELQIYLGFELNFNDEKENSMEHTRIVSILRAMSFMHDPSFLHNYLNLSLLNNYLLSCPMLLHSIYEDLLLPLPPQLHHLSSPSSILSLDGTDPLNDIISSPKSVSSAISAPWNDFDLLTDKPEKPSQLLRNVSFSQAPRRQIELPILNRDNNCRRSDRIASVKKNKSTNIMDESQITENVRRSLFAQKSFTNSVTPVKKSEQLVLKTKKVAETPTSKQGIKRSLKRQEHISRKLTENDIKAIANTPGKDLHNLDFLACSQPICNSRKSLFYSTKTDSSKSRSINRYQNLEQRMTSNSINKNLAIDLFNINQSKKVDANKSVIVEPDLADKSGTNITNINNEGPIKCFTSPRRVTARVLFAPLLSPTPKKASLFNEEDLSSCTPKKTQLFSPNRDTNLMTPKIKLKVLSP